MRTWAALVTGLVMLVVLAAVSGPSTGQDQPESRINLELRDADIQDALALLFRGSGSSYTVQPGVSGKVTLTLRDVTFDQALRMMMNALGLEYQKVDNVYEIRKKSVVSRPPVIEPEPVREVRQPTSEGTRVQQPTARGKIHMVQVRYADAGEIAALFGGYAIGQGWGAGALGPAAYGIGGFTPVGGGLLGFGGYGEYGGTFGYGAPGGYFGGYPGGYGYPGGFAGGYGARYGYPGGYGYGVGYQGGYGYGMGYPGGYGYGAGYGGAYGGLLRR